MLGRTTEKNFRELKSAEQYEQAKLTGMLKSEFTTVLDRFITRKKATTMQIVERTGISKSYVNKLRNPSEKTVQPTRNVVIDIALAINLNLDETNRLLKSARYHELYTRDKSEALIIWGMTHKMDGQKIKTMLQEKGMESIFKNK